MPRSKKGPEDAAPKKAAAKKTTSSRAKKTTTKQVEAPVVAQSVVATESSAPVQDVASHERKPSIEIEHEIRIRAYQLFIERNGGHGDPQQDWLRAEAEIRAKLIA